MKTYEQIKKETEKINEEKGYKNTKKEIYISRTKLGFCKNEGCNNQRRHSSAYCEECSNKNK